jgi:hypothetical protein
MRAEFSSLLRREPQWQDLVRCLASASHYQFEGDVFWTESLADLLS